LAARSRSLTSRPCRLPSQKKKLGEYNLLGWRGAL
jgi:hypothetical protein